MTNKPLYRSRAAALLNLVRNCHCALVVKYIHMDVTHFARSIWKFLWIESSCLQSENSSLKMLLNYLKVWNPNIYSVLLAITTFNLFCVWISLCLNNIHYFKYKLLFYMYPRSHFKEYRLRNVFFKKYFQINLELKTFDIRVSAASKLMQLIQFQWAH